MDDLYSFIVGGLRFAPSEFWGMTIKEAGLVIKGDKARQENDFMINYIAQRNAIGTCLSDKYKFENPFEKDKKEKKSTPKKTADELKEELKDMINSWR